jgi:N-acetylglucosaminyldiphosphoundecaprenol N-acetyl-beta-D-mannosaminyltransferase
VSSKIISIDVDPISYSEAVTRIIGWVNGGESRSVFAANVHMLMEAHDSLEFQSVVNHADMVTPDGMPLVWAMRMKGIKNQHRIYGPTLMLHLLAAAAKEHISVGLLGSTEEVLTKLSVRFKEQYPGLNIALQIAPPFRPFSDDEDKKMVQQISGSGVHLLFVGLGCPKQEYWIDEHRGIIQSVMVGVGAAFDFHAGIVPQAPNWMQRVGLEWLFRLIQEPRRLWKRYLRNNPRFMALLFGELIKERWKRQ